MLKHLLYALLLFLTLASPRRISGTSVASALVRARGVRSTIGMGCSPRRAECVGAFADVFSAPNFRR